MTGQYKKERRAAPEAPKEVALSPAPPLTDRERARIQATIPQVKEHFPELVPMIKDFTEAGLIHGWRNVHIKVEKNGTD